jgi:small subunit ribosomal protein S1
MSQINRLPGTDPEHWLGQTLEFKVLETGDKIVLSRRTLQEEQLEGVTEAFWESAEVGAVVAGTVTSVHEWGAYVDLDGVGGRLHKRDMSWDGNVDPIGVLARGQSIQAQIVSMEPENRRVGLSIKNADDDPWSRAGVEFVVNGEYTGRVTRIEPFGAFVQLAVGLTGLVHVSNFRKKGEGLPSKGDDIPVVIRSIDTERRRLDLGLQGADVDLTDTMVKGSVTEVMRNGVVVQLEDGGTGWLAANEVDLPAGTVLAQRFRRGRAVTARILATDGNRLTLTMKEATDQDGSWRQSSQNEQGSFGTFGDLFKNLPKG